MIPEESFTIDKDVSLEEHDESQLKWRWVPGQGPGPNWVRLRRRRPASYIPLKRRMHFFVTCDICHINPVLRTDRYGTRIPDNEMFCSDCLPEVWRERWDDLPFIGGAGERQQENRTEATGEQRLAAAIIHSAATDIWRETRYHGGSKLRLYARQWLFGERPTQISFLDCCELLGMDPEYVRHAILSNGERFTDGVKMRLRAGVGHRGEDAAVGEYVPVEGLSFSSPFRRKLAKYVDPEKAQALIAIATYTS